MCMKCVAWNLCFSGFLENLFAFWVTFTSKVFRQVIIFDFFINFLEDILVGMKIYKNMIALHQSFS